MIIRMKHGLYVSSIAMASNPDNVNNAYIDTGATKSCMTTGYLNKLAPGYADYIFAGLKFDNIVRLANYESINVASIELRNVVVCGFGLPSFYCDLQRSNHLLCLLGSDFVSACHGTLDYDELRLAEFSSSVYAGNVKRLYKEPAEVNTVTKEPKTLNAYFAKMGIHSKDVQLEELDRLKKLYNTAYLVEIVNNVYRDFM